MGDRPGHPFRGNQYTRGRGGGGRRASFGRGIARSTTAASARKGTRRIGSAQRRNVGAAYQHAARRGQRSITSGRTRGKVGTVKRRRTSYNKPSAALRQLHREFMATPRSPIAARNSGSSRRGTKARSKSRRSSTIIRGGSKGARSFNRTKRAVVQNASRGWAPGRRGRPPKGTMRVGARGGVKAARARAKKRR